MASANCSSGCLEVALPMEDPSAFYLSATAKSAFSDLTEKLQAYTVNCPLWREMFRSGQGSCGPASVVESGHDS
jgi:hypothetical protein